MRRVFKINEHQYRLLEKEVINLIFRDDKPVRLDESLGISNEVVRVAQDLYNKANERIDELIMGKVVCMKEKIWNIEKVEIFIKAGDYADGSSNYFKNGVYAMIYVNALISDNKIDRASFMDTLQHELQHIFQQNKIRLPYRPNTSGMVNDGIRDINLSKNAIATILYIADPFEQNGFINGMYAYIKSCKEDGKLPISVEKIDAYLQLKRIYNAFNYIIVNKNSEALNEVIKEYAKLGYNFKKIKSRAIDGIKSLKKKIDRTLEKCKKDGFTEEGITVFGESDFYSNLTKNSFEYGNL